jgi:DNA-binding LacI/PurR family transcriptional regulator
MNDKALPGLIRGVEKQGLRIPEDVSIVSIVSSEGAAALFLPPVTTFEMDIHTLMNAVITQLTAKLDGRYAELTRRLFPCILRERQSTAALNHE